MINPNTKGTRALATERREGRGSGENEKYRWRKSLRKKNEEKTLRDYLIRGR
jgi:hypothetical protein